MNLAYAQLFVHPIWTDAIRVASQEFAYVHTLWSKEFFHRILARNPSPDARRRILCFYLPVGISQDFKSGYHPSINRFAYHRF